EIQQDWLKQQYPWALPSNNQPAFIYQSYRFKICRTLSIVTKRNSTTKIIPKNANVSNCIFHGIGIATIIFASNTQEIGNKTCAATHLRSYGSEQRRWE